MKHIRLNTYMFRYVYLPKYKSCRIMTLQKSIASVADNFLWPTHNFVYFTVYFIIANVCELRSMCWWIVCVIFQYFRITLQQRNCTEIEVKNIICFAGDIYIFIRHLVFCYFKSKNTKHTLHELFDLANVRYHKYVFFVRRHTANSCVTNIYNNYFSYTVLLGINFIVKLLSNIFSQVISANHVFRINKYLNNDNYCRE